MYRGRTNWYQTLNPALHSTHHSGSPNANNACRTRLGSRRSLWQCSPTEHDYSRALLSGDDKPVYAVRRSKSLISMSHTVQRGWNVFHCDHKAVHTRRIGVASIALGSIPRCTLLPQMPPATHRRIELERWDASSRRLFAEIVVRHNQLVLVGGKVPSAAERSRMETPWPSLQNRRPCVLRNPQRRKRKSRPIPGKAFKCIKGPVLPRAVDDDTTAQNLE